MTASPDLSVWDVRSRTLTGKEVGYLQRTIRRIYDSILSYKTLKRRIVFSVVFGIRLGLIVL